MDPIFNIVNACPTVRLLFTTLREKLNVAQSKGLIIKAFYKMAGVLKLAAKIAGRQWALVTIAAPSSFKR
jgi:hypothetical protein